MIASRRSLIGMLCLPVLGLNPVKAESLGRPPGNGLQAREEMVAALDRIARPVMQGMATGTLRATLPIRKGEENRSHATHLEAFGRTLAGIAPWLNLPPDDTPEGKLRAQYRDWALKGLDRCTKPDSPDRLNFSEGSQPLVDAAFLAQALLRAPEVLWAPLSQDARDRLAKALMSTRNIKPYDSNWLLFSALVESALWKFTGSCEMKPIEYALTRHEAWFLGDGTYGDGPKFHWDYYNSYVIQPAILEVLEVAKEKQSPLAKALPVSVKRAQRHAGVLERLISPEGTFPVMGRSSSYRFGAFHLLSMMALRHQLPESVQPAAVREALRSVIRRTLAAPGTFDSNGWLQTGAVGHQPSIREHYISTGSLYLCLFGMLHLGLPESDPLWQAPAANWTQKRIWMGEDVPADHAW